MALLSDRDVSLLKVLLDRGVVRVEAVEDLLHRALPAPDGLGQFLFENHLVPDPSQLQRAAQDMQTAREGDVLARIDLEDQVVIQFIQQGQIVDAATLERARQFQTDLGRRGRVRDLASVLVEGGRVAPGLAIELKRRVALYLHRCRNCGHYYTVQPAEQPRSYKCRHCGAQIDVPAVTFDANGRPIIQHGGPPPPPPSSGARNPVVPAVGPPALAMSASVAPSGRFPAPQPVHGAVPGSGSHFQAVDRHSPDPALKTLSRSAGSSAKFSFAEVVARELAEGSAEEGQLFGDFLIRRELGRGGMGIVYHAIDRRNRTEVALKVLSFGLEASAKQIKRFQREADAASSLRHPGLVRVLESGCIEGYHYLVQEFVKGRGLDEILKEKKGNDPRWGAKVLSQVADAISHAHAKSILHRDLKPANILIEDDSGKPRVTDFGLAKKLDDDQALTRTGAAIGTPYYMSPEQVTGKRDKIGPGIDIYAIGVMLYEVLTGKLPFQAATPVELYNKVANEDPRRPSEVRKTVPKQLEAVCLRCLEKDPKSRYTDAKELAKDLKRFGRGESVSVRAPSTLGRAVRKRGRLIAGIGVAIACAALGAIVALSFGGDGDPSGDDPDLVTGGGIAVTDESAEKTIARADVALAEERWSDAIALYGEAIAMDPSEAVEARALARRGRAHRENGDREGARSDLDRALDIEPDAVDARVDRALLRRKADLAGAREDLEHARRADGTRTDVLATLGDVLVELGEATKACAVLERPFDDQPDSFLLAAAYARALSAAGNTTEALDALERAIGEGLARATSAEECEIRLARARLLLDRAGEEDGAEALRDLEEALARDSDAFHATAGAHSLLARAHLLANDVEAALTAANAAIARNPDDLAARRVRAIIKVCGKTATEAAEDAARLIAADPDDLQGLIAKGALAYFESRLGEATVLLDRALARDPSHPIALFFRGFIAANSPNDGGTVLRMAERIFDPERGRFAEMAPFPRRAAEAYVLRGFGRFRGGDVPGAIADLEEAKRRFSPLPNASSLLAQIYTEQKDWENAERELTALHEMAPTDPSAAIKLGTLRFRMRRWQDALTVLEKVAQQKLAIPVNLAGEYHFTRGVCLIRFKMPIETAIDQLDKALARGFDPADGLTYLLAALLIAKNPRAETVETQLTTAADGGATLGTVRVALARIIAGDREGSLDALERAAAAGLNVTAPIEAEPDFEDLKAEQRYQQVIHRVRQNGSSGGGGS